MSDLNDDLDDQFDPNETLENDPDQGVTEGFGPVGGDSDDDIGEYEPGDDQPLPEFDEVRAELLRDDPVLADLDLPRQADPESEPDTNVQHESRIDLTDEYEPGFEESQRERFEAEKAEKAKQEFIEWSREFSAQQAAARRAAQAPSPEQREVAPPSVFDESAMDSETFDRILAARDAGLDYVPAKTDVDVSAVYGQFSARSEPEDDGF